MEIKESAEEIKRTLNEELNNKVSVALFGQPGAGKSSMINKIVGREVAEVGVETDKTVNAAEYEVNGLNLVDLPGYGTKNFPKDTYFNKFKINNFDLFLCLTSGKLHKADTEFFQDLQKIGKKCIFVVNKYDEIWEDGVTTEELERRKIEDILKHVNKQVIVVFTSCKTNHGFDDLMKQIEINLQDIKKDRWIRSAKSYSEDFLIKKKESCSKYVTLASLVSAANGINPVIGADIAVDIGILIKLFSSIREDYGLTDCVLDKLKEDAIPIISQLANNILKFAVKEGILILFKQSAGKQAVKSFSKYIPFVGQAIAAGIGYAITSNVGGSYLDNCHELAKQILKKDLGI